ncbi:hypothetical protein ABLN87_15475 [Ruegeria sp. SCPT10]|uniref:hypothetical protein n=1 Tax=Ruegeria sp. SCP10 TaxID=3141377 RepID=UPI003334C741
MKPLLHAIGGTMLLALASAFSLYVAAKVMLSAPNRARVDARVEHYQPDVSAKSRNFTRSPRSKNYYLVIVERPLFAPERRPRNLRKTAAELEADIVEAELRSSANLTVMVHGVMMGAKENKVLISVEGANPDWARIGAKINGWIVSDIGTDWVEMKQGTETLRFEMYQ